MLLRKQAIKNALYSPHLLNASALPKKMLKHKNCVFSFECCITALSDPPVPGLIYSVLLQLILMLL